MNNMNYELAKQLKDAGFPQNTQWAFVINPHDREKVKREMTMEISKENDSYANLLKANYEVVSIPSLSELIEACGEKLVKIWKQQDGYNNFTQGWCVGYSDYGVYVKNKTVIEAVANFWLELQVIPKKGYSDLSSKFTTKKIQKI